MINIKLKRGLNNEDGKGVGDDQFCFSHGSLRSCDVSLRQTGSVVFMAYGPGNEPCADFDAIRNRRLGNLTSDQHQLVEKTLEYWVSGFYTAWNYFSSDTFDISGGMKYGAILEQLEKYCERNPDKKLVEAAIVVGHALHSTRSKVAPRGK